MTDVPYQQKRGDASLERFVLDKDGEHIIDTLNLAGPKTSHFEDCPKDQIHLREAVLCMRLNDLVDRLIINLNPREADGWGGTYQPFNRECEAIRHSIYNAIVASRLSTLEPALSIQNRFDGTLKRIKAGLQEVTSLSLFRDDVELLLRDLYGDCAGDAMDRVLDAVLVIVLEFTQFVRKDLYDEHHCAMDWDYNLGIGVPDGYGISGSDHRRGHKALNELRVRVREVPKNPSAFNKYTVEFATHHFEEWVIMEPDGERLRPGIQSGSRS
jgi:hypothetical protein